MYDLINTKYEDAEIIIDVNTADKAISLIKEKLKKDKNNEELLAYLSKAYLYKRDLKSALKYIKKSLKLNPDYLYAKARLLKIKFDLNTNSKCEDYEDDVKNILKSSCFNACIYSMILLITKDKLQKKTANTIIKNIKKPKNPFEYLTLLRALYMKNEYKKCLKLQNYGSENDLPTYDSYCLFSLIYFNLGEYKKSFVQARRAMQICYNDFYVHYRCGFALFKTKKFDKALFHLKEAIKYGCTFDDVYDLITLIYAIKNEKKNVKKYIKKTSPGFNLNKTLGKYYYEEYDYKTALDYMLQAEKDGCFDFYMFNVMAYIFYYESDDEYNAMKYLNKSLLLNSGYTYSHFLKGRIYYGLQNYDKAKKEFLYVEQKSNDYPVILGWLSYIYHTEGDYNKALAYANKSLLLLPEDGFSYYRRGYTLMAKEEFDKALIAFKKAEELKCNYYDLYEQISFINYIKGNYKEAVNYINKELLTDYGYPELYRIKGDILIEMHKIKSAKECYAKYERMISCIK